MSTLVESLNGTRGWGLGAGRLLMGFGLRFTVIALATFLVAVVILTGLFLANLDTLFAGILGVQDPILIPVQDSSVLNN